VLLTQQVYQTGLEGSDVVCIQRFKVRLMFDWGGGCLWSGNEACLEAFAVGPIEDRLPLSAATRQRLLDLSAWHDESLDWNYPPDPSPWSAEERQGFEEAVAEFMVTLRVELGPEFEVVFIPLCGYPGSLP
jgi:hypothetical protein